MDPLQPNQQPNGAQQPNQVQPPQQPQQNVDTNQTQQPNQAVPPVNNNSLEDFIRQWTDVNQEKQVQQPIPWVPPVPQPSTQSQIIEKVVYKKQKVHGFFRTLTIISLVVVGFLMLLETLNVFSLNINGFDLNLIYPIFVIFSSIVIWSYRWLFGKIFGLLLFLVVVGWFFIIGVYTSLNPSTQTQFWSYVAYPSVAWSQYTKLYLSTLVSDLTFQWKQSENLIEWNYGSDRNLLVYSGQGNGYQYYSLQEEINLNLLQNYYSVLSLWVQTTQPLYLYVKNLFALQKIDFSDILLRSAKIHAAGLISDIIIGNNISSKTTLDIESALADVTIHLPKDVWVILYYEQLVWQLELNNFEQKWDGHFESTNISTAQKIITITMKFGAARTKVVWDK